MLGISSGLMYSDYVEGCSEELVAMYTSDFSGGVDGWVPYSVEGTLTLDGNIDGFNGEDNTLRGTYDTTQTNVSGIKKVDAFSDVRVGDRFEVVQVKMYFDSAYDSYTNLWDGEDIVSGHIYIQGVGVVSYLVYTWGATQDEWDTPSFHTYAPGPDYAVNTNGDLYILFPKDDPPSDLPQENARFYIKDIIIKQYRCG